MQARCRPRLAETGLGANLGAEGHGGLPGAVAFHAGVSSLDDTGLVCGLLFG